jgi:hypothetical protein
VKAEPKQNTVPFWMNTRHTVRDSRKRSSTVVSKSSEGGDEGSVLGFDKTIQEDVEREAI